MARKRKQDRFTFGRRAAGVLLHPTSLPGPLGVGDIGAAARDFVDWLHAAGQTWWQMLPINPLGPGYSPYSARSAFAGYPLLIDLDELVSDGLLAKRDLKPPRLTRRDRAAYGATERFKYRHLKRAFRAFAGDGGLESRAFTRYCEDQSEWLDDYALFAALVATQSSDQWVRWPHALRLRRRTAIREAKRDLRDIIDLERFLQFVFDRQWAALRGYANERNVGLIGDIPIFVAHNAGDVWAHRGLFDLDANGRAKTVSGAPPDDFAKTGQRWGHPQYRWQRHKTTGFKWWIARFARTFEQFDAARIDHFLGFNRVWSVKGSARTAKNGTWIKTPGTELFTTLRKQLGRCEIIAEDLGAVTPEALALRDRFGFPGMRLLHFAFFDDEGNRYNQPHNHPANCVTYPGTHDNETTVGWLESLKRDHQRRRGNRELTPYERVLRYTGTTGRSIHWDMIRLTLSSPANTAIIPAQDLLGLDNRARMNTPATIRGNWVWRLKPGQLTGRTADHLRDLTHAYERLPHTPGT